MFKSSIDVKQDIESQYQNDKSCGWQAEKTMEKSIKQQKQQVASSRNQFDSVQENQ